jgi:putative transposase
MAHLRKQDSKVEGIFQVSSEEDVFRRLLRTTIQQVLEEEMTAFLNAEPYTRTEGRQGYRNGYKPRVLNTRVGRMELMVPKDRAGDFQSELFDKYQRSEKALFLAITEMYIQGVSTRKVKKITEELCGLEISKSQVSSIAKRLDDEIEAWRMRSLEGKRYPYLVMDARYEKVRQNGSVTSKGVLIVVGIDEDGYRETLGVWCEDLESEATWSGVFRELTGRGLAGVEYVVSDDHKGLIEAVKRCFQGIIWQRCQVHFIRNILGMAPKSDRGHIVALLKEITVSQTSESAHSHLAETVDKLSSTHHKIADHLDTHGEEILAVYALPEKHRKRMRTTNMLERFNEEIKRRTRVIRIFPNEQSCLRLVSALAIEANEEWMARKYLDMGGMENQTETKSHKYLIHAPVQPYDFRLSV